MQNPYFGSKIKIQIKLPKSILQIINTRCVQKTARKSTKYARNETILKSGHPAKAIAHSKKHVEIPSTNHLEVFRAENRSKKHQILPK